MFNALFIDDEIIVREGIERRVYWESHGFHLLATFSHGLQAKEYLQSHDDVHLVFSDISMPIMDGLELAQYIHEHHPQIYVLLLTGYDEFEYAQEAIKYNVKELLLKPITAKEVGAVLDGVYEVLLGERHRMLEQQELQQKLTESLPLLQERFLNRLTAGKVPEEGLQEQMESYKLPVLMDYTLCIIIDTCRGEAPEDREPSDDLYQISVFDLCQQHLDYHDIAFFNKEDQPVCILQHNSSLGLQKKSRLFCEKVRQQINSHYGRPISFGIGRIASEAADIPFSYRDAEKALSQQYVLGRNRIITRDQISGSSASLHDIRKDFEEDLLYSLKTQPSARSREIIKRYFRETFAEHVSVRSAQLQTYMLLSTIVSFLEEASIPVMEVLPPSEQGDDLSLVTAGRSREEVEHWFIQFIDLIHHYIGRQSMDHSEQRIRQAVEYLETHYHDPDLSIQTVCRELNISASHFSAQFKRLTGKTFVEYLTSLRIQQASMLLKTTNLCAYEIAEQIGYEDSHYFSQVFKKHTGMTIREYRGMFTETADSKEDRR